LLQQTLYNPEFWKHLSIPFVAAIVGWGTNWIAIKLTFQPLEYVGLRPFLGWQGIIPSKAAKMARIFVDRTMFRLGTLKELFLLMEPDRIAAHVSGVMDRRLEGYTDEILFYRYPAVWKLLPQAVKQKVYDRVREEMPRLVRELMDEISDHFDELLDFKSLLVERLEGDKQLLNRLFLEAGSEEFKFIIRSGLYFGFLFGLVQLAVWTFHKSWWVLPGFGLFVGYATNWFAINIIFRPLNPVRILGWRVQGLFLKRQPEVSRVWCRLVTTEILTLQRIIYGMLYGSRSDRVRQLIRRRIEPVVDRVMADYRPVADVVVRPEALAGIREAVGDKAVAVSTDPFDHWPFNRDRSARVEELLGERMRQLAPEEFQDLLRPCFQEDEMKLIVMGGVLGLLAGVAQLLFVFGV